MAPTASSRRFSKTANLLSSMQSLLNPGPPLTGRLSSAMTVYFKFVQPAIWLFIAVPWTILAIRGGISGEDLLVLPILALLGVCVYLTGIRLKRVILDRETLTVSNYRKETRVPLRSIAA